MPGVQAQNLTPTDPCKAKCDLNGELVGWGTGNTEGRAGGGWQGVGPEKEGGGQTLSWSREKRQGRGQRVRTTVHAETKACVNDLNSVGNPERPKTKWSSDT